MHQIARLSADFRKLGWCVVAALSIPPILGFTGVRFAAPVVEDWIPQKDVESLVEVEHAFSLNSPVVLVLECDDFFQVDRIQAMQKAVTTLRAMDEVKHLTWMGDIPEVTLRGKITHLLPNLSTAAELPATEPTERTTANDVRDELQQAKMKLLQHPLAKDSLVSAGGTTVLLLIDADLKSQIAAIRAAAIQVLQPLGIRTRVTGSLALFELHDRTLDEDHLRIQMLSYTVVSLLSVVIFRRPVAIFLAGIGPIIGVVWTLGWLQLIGQSNNELAKIILPVLIMMVGFTDGMHMVIRIRQLRAEGRSPRDAVYNAVCLVGPACFLTSLTTAIGFGSLMFSNSEMIAGFGRVSAIGVVLTFLSVVLITPLLANSWLGRKMHVSTTKDPLALLMQRARWIVVFSSRYARSVTIAGVAITLLCFSMAMNLVPDDRISDRVPHNSEEWQALRHCDSVVGGVRFLRIVVEWDESISRSQLWTVIKESQKLLATEELVGPSISIRTCLSVFKAPTAQDQSILAARLPEELSSQFYRPDLRQAQIVCRLQDRGIAKYEPMLRRLEENVQAIAAAHNGVRLSVISDLAVEGRVVRQMIEELMKSLILASFIIFGVLAVAFRSLRVGLISILPNVMPLAVSGALRLLIGESLGIASACSFAICLGIAVDDTIHYLIHFQHERQLKRSAHEANCNTFVTVGSALIMTTVVMTAGLATVMTSRMPPHVNFAAMGCATLVAALLADLFFLPALLSLFPGKLEHGAIMGETEDAEKRT